MKQKSIVICKAFLWCIIILLFPVISGTISVIKSLDAVEILLLQGIFMVISLFPPIILVLTGKWSWKDIGFTQFNVSDCKRVLFFIPVLIIFLPVAIKGFYVESTEYVLGNLFLYLFVGISEEIYFRGIIPQYLKKEFSTIGVMIWSTFIFGIGHLTTAFAGSSAVEIALTVLNAFIFGWLAIEMTIISSNIIPAVIIHFIFDFETKIVSMDGSDLLIAECIRGVIMFFIASWFATVIYEQRKR